MTSSLSPDPAFIRPEVRMFFRDIKEHPDDDTPRLIFADWLQEHGDAAAAARGEFLRSCVLRHRLSPDDPSYNLLKRREGELFTEHRWNWLGPLADQSRGWGFERGLIQIWAQAEKVLTPEVAAWARTEAGLWIDALTLSDTKPRHLAALAESPLLPHLNTLDLSDNRLRHGLESLCDSANLRQLTKLVLSRNRFRTGAFLALLSCPHLVRLATLELEGNQLNLADAIALAHSMAFPKLTTLRVGRNTISGEGRTLLQQRFGEGVRFDQRL